MSKQKKSEAADESSETKEVTKRLTFDVAEELHRKLKVRAAETGKSMGELLTEWCNEKLAKPHKP